ncbi:MAG: hypothetical protein MK207_08885 [Saprospiraceae bacterium]|nr:hypothetical protein [Saprospiraceae bacterium]
MNRAFCLFVLLIIANYTFSQSDSSKVLVDSMDVEETSAIKFDFRNKGLESFSWEKDFIRVELEVVANFPDVVLSQLLKAGRYNLLSSVDGEVFNIIAPNLDKAVTIGGEDLVDHVRLIIRTPGVFGLNDSLFQKHFPSEVVRQVVNNSQNKDSASLALNEMSKIKEQLNFTIRFVYDKEKALIDGDRRINKVSSILNEDKEDNKDEEINSGFIMGDKKSLDSNSSLKDVESKFGDIIMGGMPLDDFND